MEHSPFEGLFRALLPIIIFIAWAMLSKPAQKRKKEQEARDRQRRQEIEMAEKKEKEPDELSDERDDNYEQDKSDRKRSIEEVLEDLGFPVERKPDPQPTPAKPQEKKTVNTPEKVEKESSSPEDHAPEIVPEKTKVSGTKVPVEVPEGAYKLAASPIDNQKAYSSEVISPMADCGSQIHQEQMQTVHVSKRDLQKFIVWSELLGKPIALKEEENLNRM